ncbi:hypothetical protein [Herbiconiux liangxiaofengii]|uniref:hypothetical protein n=1 Tax=Herbiconiux liangxiaofengii TaxID=3342795 RepID=UPI0035B7A8FC
MTTWLSRGTRSWGSGRRPRAVWAAFVTAAVLVALVVAGVLLPVLGLIGAAAGGTGGTLRIPVGQIAVALAIGYGLALLLLVLCIRRRNGVLAWILGVAAIVAVLVVSVWPLVAVAISGASQAQDVIPQIQQIITQFSGR